MVRANFIWPVTVTVTVTGGSFRSDHIRGCSHMGWSRSLSSNTAPGYWRWVAPHHQRRPWIAGGLYGVSIIFWFDILFYILLTSQPSNLSWINWCWWYFEKNPSLCDQRPLSDSHLSQLLPCLLKALHAEHYIFLLIIKTIFLSLSLSLADPGKTRSCSTLTDSFIDSLIESSFS